ncbi:TRM11 family SAM-dependent methyltransferase [Paeniglutamicibacter psychrophenolicus]|uniref:Methyltransferase n=1 Tax=Paeniglutamicibacter psychrophenolicus TaxID=257454 RepID=A0ABS4WG94_9MICC|nr:DNA methyltransferase [Paeniglutamicibacter psychrophenolicus]MBP2375232.1 DNA modification methylase [Paeniglutamicibacter psychrophenolicus]
MIESTPKTSPLDSQLTATHDTFVAERPPGADEDVHMVSAIVDHIIERCSNPGDLVFDPFAGFGTTLIRAIALGREALGIELLPERVDYLRDRMPDAHIIEGDSRELLRLVRGTGSPLPDADINLIVASPPYMTAENHEPDPLTAYEENDGDYDRYLDELGLVAAQCARVVVPGGFVVWNLADIHHMNLTTHLIRDCKRALGRHLTLVGETEILWDQYPHDLISDALLVFQRPPGAPRM